MELIEFRYENYKTFKTSQTVKVKPLTIFIGKNNSGKSAAIRLPLLLFQSLMLKTSIPLELEFDNLDFGSDFLELIYNQNSFTRPKFGLKFFIDQSFIDIDITIALLKGYGKSILQNKLMITDWNLKKEGASILNIKWQEADIIPPVYVVKDNKKENEDEILFQGLLPINVKTDSKDAKNLLEILKVIDSFIPQNYFPPFREVPERYYIKRFNIEKGIRRLSSQAPQILIQDFLSEGTITKEIGDWYEQNMEGWRLELIEVPDNNPLFRIVLKSPKDQGVKVNIVDTGHGTSQAFPLVLSALLKREKQREIDIIEEPELHLHPGAHGNLLELFANAAIGNGVKYLIETHSEVFLLRLQRLIAEQKKLQCGTSLTSDDVVIYWVDNEVEEGSCLKEITIDEQGELSDWPKGVFEEDYNESIKIREAQENKR